MTSSFNKWFRLVGTPLFGLLLYLMIYYIDPRSFQTEHYQSGNGWQMYCYDLLACLAGSYLLSETSIGLTRVLDRLSPWEHKPLVRFGLQLLTLILISIAVLQAIIYLLVHAEPAYQLTEIDQLSIRQTLVFGSLMALFINAIHTGEYFLRRWRVSMLEAERLKRESAEARFEILRSQLDPHFLFNNLNTLIYLVEDKPQAVAFVEKLSLVYRYILQSRERTLVSLREELTLAHAYLFLLQQRYGAGIQVTIDVPDWALDRQIPPMTLQLLLENAVKHNQVDAINPLVIRLTTNEPNQLVVENSVHPRLAVEGHTRIGLENIRSRYQILAGVEPEIQHTARTFFVKLPLLTDERVTH